MMQSLQISDQTAKQLHDLAERAHITRDELIERLIKKYSEELAKQNKPPEQLTDFARLLADSPSFVGNPLDIQKAMRDEWN